MKLSKYDGGKRLREYYRTDSVSENFAFKKTSTLNVLAKTTTYGCTVKKRKQPCVALWLGPKLR